MSYYRKPTPRILSKSERIARGINTEWKELKIYHKLMKRLIDTKEMQPTEYRWLYSVMFLPNEKQAKDTASWIALIRFSMKDHILRYLDKTIPDEVETDDEYVKE